MFFDKKSKNVLVYPANNYKGYMICKELAHKSEHSHGQRMEVNEVLAVCCGKGGMYEKLKELGRPIKTIVLDDASRISEWKKEMKDRKCNVMMLCTDGMPSHHQKMRNARDDARDELMKFSKSLECAIEMCPHMNCKGLVVSTAFCADESKFKFWNHIYKAVEKAAQKHVKGECAVLFHNMMFEALFLSRKEIVDENTLSWPVSEDAKACPMAFCDYGRCCIEVMRKIIKEENIMSSRHKKYHLTGADKLTSRDMAIMMGEALDMPIDYNEIDRKEWRHMIEEDHKLSQLQIQLFEETFEMMEKGCLKKRTNDYEKLTGRQPMEFAEWLEKHGDEFENPQHH